MDWLFRFIFWVGADNLGCALFALFWGLLILAVGRETTGGLGNQR